MNVSERSTFIIISSDYIVFSFTSTSPLRKWNITPISIK